MAQLLYQDDVPAPRRRRKKKGRQPRPLTAESRDVKLLRLPYRELVTIGQAAEIMGVERKSLQNNYLYGYLYLLPDYIELVRDAGKIVGLKRVGP